MTLLVAMNLPKPAGKVLAIARSTVARMQANPLFPAPNPPLSVIVADIDAVAVADAEVLTRTRGTRATRDALLAKLRRDLKHLACYVQAVADASGAEGEAVIESTGFAVKRPSIRTKAPFKVVAGRSPGSVRLLAKWAGDRAAYGWRYSTDETTWTLLPITLQSSTTLSGLAKRTTYLFQHRVTTKDGVGDWGETLAFALA